MAMTIVDLLADHAAVANRILAEFTPKLSKAEYLACLREVE
jgi:hypothetical protein